MNARSQRIVVLVTCGLWIAAAFILAAPTMPTPTYSELLGRVHLAGCALPEHGPRSKHRCLDLRAELRAALRDARRRALKEAAAMVRGVRTEPRTARSPDASLVRGEDVDAVSRALERRAEE